jgi:hypothetical protein
VFDPSNLSVAPAVLVIEGEDPRALATDGQRVYAAIFESGNRTTILRHQVVSEPDGPYAGQNPPPNSGTQFSPAIEGDLPNPPPVGLIVRRQDDGTWRDDNGADWTAKVTWNLHDHDVAVIDADTLDVSYMTGLMNLNMALAVQPGCNRVTVVGTDALNHLRFEPNVNGVFLRANLATFDSQGLETPAGSSTSIRTWTTRRQMCRKRYVINPLVIRAESPGIRVGRADTSPAWGPTT